MDVLAYCGERGRGKERKRMVISIICRRSIVVRQMARHRHRHRHTNRLFHKTFTPGLDSFLPLFFNSLINLIISRLLHSHSLPSFASASSSLAFQPMVVSSSIVAATVSVSALLAAFGAKKAFTSLTAHRGVTLPSLRAVDSAITEKSAYPENYYPGKPSAPFAFS